MWHHSGSVRGDETRPGALRVVAVLWLLSAVAAAAPADVVTQHNDNARTGATLAETLLTTQNVNDARFGKLFARAVTGALYAQPLYLSSVPLAGGARNLVFVATMHNLVYAFDADDPAAAAPVWTATLEPPVALPDANIGAGCGVYKDIAGEIGIVSTPVLDAARQLLYVVTFSKSGAVYSHHLHALSILDGSEQLGGPVALAASVPGTGDGSSGGNLAFQSVYENQRAALLLSNGQIYIAFASYCDSGPYHGWVLAYDATSLASTAVYNPTADGSEGGFWQSGQGASADENGKIYLSCGNGTFDYSTGGIDLGEGFARLSATLQVEDWFVPFDFAALNAVDRDLGSTGLLLIPGSTLLVGGSKAGAIYVADRTNLGHYHSADNDQIAQFFALTSGGGVWGSPVYWSGPGGPTVYVWGQGDNLKAFHFDGSKLVTPPAFQNTTVAPPKMPGGILSVSADGAAAGSGIVWSNMSINASANQAVVPGVLRAFDAANVGVQLWSSEDVPARDSFGNLAKFSAPTVANGKVYLSTFSNQMVAYGLLPKALLLAASPSPVPFPQPATLTATVIGPAPGMPTGQVAFFDGAAPLGSGTLDGAGQARWTGGLGVGVHALSASYPGDGNFAAVTSAELDETVLQAPSVTTLAGSKNPSSLGDAVTLTAQVSAAATPTGTVSFSDGAAPLGNATLDGSGAASLVVSSLALGTHSLVAVYFGDAQVAGSGGNLSLVVGRASVTLTALATPNPASFGAPVQIDLTATASQTPSGMVTLSEAGSPLATATLDASGHAQLHLTAGAPGPHALSIDYAGDSDCLPSSTPLSLIVGRAGSVVSLTVTEAGDDWSLAATVSGGSAGTPTGTITFRDGAGTLGSAALDASGTAGWQLARTAGLHLFVAQYGGDDHLSSSQSPTVEEQLAPAGTDAAMVAPDLSTAVATGGCACSPAGRDSTAGGWMSALVVCVVVLRRRRRACTMPPWTAITNKSRAPAPRPPAARPDSILPTPPRSTASPSTSGASRTATATSRCRPARWPRRSTSI